MLWLISGSGTAPGEAASNPPGALTNNVTAGEISHSTQSVGESSSFRKASTTLKLTKGITRQKDWQNCQQGQGLKYK